MDLKELTGHDLGEYDVGYDARDAILYALSVGASASQLDLVYERDLRVLPTFACALGLWAVERAGELGAYDRKRSLHASQGLVVYRALPPQARIATRARIAAVWDKGKASVVEIEVNADIFTAIYGIFLPGLGGWGGSSGPKTIKEVDATAGEPWRTSFATSENAAALYRLTGDLHPIHIDADVARANGFEKPILHGLCTFGIAARAIAGAASAHPADLRSIRARLSGPVMPGDSIEVSARRLAEELAFEASVDGRPVLKGGRASFVAR